jgi:PAS domain S-box-containing protein
MVRTTRVLLIGDNPADTELICDILSGDKKAPFEVIIAGTVPEGIARIEGGGVDVVLFDLGVPDGGGLAGVRRLTGVGRLVPIIVYAGAADQKAAAGALDEGAEDYLIRERMDHDALVRSIRHADERRRLEERVAAADATVERRVRERTADLAEKNRRFKRLIAEMERAERALRESEGKWRGIFEEAADAAFITSADAQVIDVNRAGAALFGLGTDRVTGVRSDAIFARHEDQVALFKKIKRHGFVKDEEVRLVRRDGVGVDCLVTGRVARDGAGRFVGYQGTIRDNTERRRSVEKILDSVPDGVFIIDARKRITYFNTAAERILGIGAESALKRPYREVVFRGKKRDSCLTRACEGAREITDREDSFVTAQGTVVPVSVSVARLADDAGRDLGNVVAFRDISTIVELKKEIDEKYTFQDIVSKNRKIKEIFDILPAIADSDSTVLIEGRSGTGKELIARAIHNLSPRREGPFVAVNCAALPDELLESELFGYVRGAFSSAARDKPGRFALAEGGTILLDEIGDLKKPLQVKLLRVLEERRYEPLGSVSSVESNVRVIASTNRDLTIETDLGNFREDLFFRINVVRIGLPELKERREDIPLLVKHFVRKAALRMGRPPAAVSDEVMDFLIQYDFPGNVRELENVVTRMLVVSSGGVIDRRHLPEELVATGAEKADEYVSFKDEMRGSERKIIEEVLARYQGNRALAARALNINRTTLWRKMQKYGLLEGGEG